MAHFEECKVHANHFFLYIVAFLLLNQVIDLETNVCLPFLWKDFHYTTIKFYIVVFLSFVTIRNKHMKISLYLQKTIPKYQS